MSDPPRLPGKCSFAKRTRTAPAPVDDRSPYGSHRPARNGKETPVPREDRRESALVRVAADCCTCVAVEGGQMHEDADETRGPPAPLKGLKRKRPVIYRDVMRRDRQALLYKNYSTRSPAACHRQTARL